MTVHFVVWLWTILGRIWHAAALVNQPVFKLDQKVSFIPFVWKTIICHSEDYFWVK